MSALGVPLMTSPRLVPSIMAIVVAEAAPADKASASAIPAASVFMYLTLLMVVRPLLGYPSAFALVCNVVIISVPFWTFRLSSTSAAPLRLSCGSTSSLSACFDVLTMQPGGEGKQAQSPYVTRTHGSVGEV